MSIQTEVFGIIIYLNGVTLNDATHGFYPSARGTQWKLIQNAVTGVTGWTDGIIAKGGLKKYSRKIDLRKGGAIVRLGT